jgi:hypothetical protein
LPQSGSPWRNGAGRRLPGEHRRIDARNLAPTPDVDVAKITTRTLDLLYAELAARGGPLYRSSVPVTAMP